jgi:hypothetical protein
MLLIEIACALYHQLCKMQQGATERCHVKRINAILQKKNNTMIFLFLPEYICKPKAEMLFNHQERNLHFQGKERVTGRKLNPKEHQDPDYLLKARFPRGCYPSRQGYSENYQIKQLQGL